MNLPRTLLLATLLTGCVPAMRITPATSTAVPRAFVGSWAGTGTQSDQPGEWTIATTITGGGVGAVVGSIGYPSLSCGGNLVLQSATAESLVLREHITYGSCIDGGNLTFSLRPGGGLAYDWHTDDGSVTARGQLSFVPMVIRG